MVAEVHAAEENMALAGFTQAGSWLRRGVHQDSRIVAQNSGQDLLA